MGTSVQNDVLRCTAKLVHADRSAIQNVFWFRLAEDIGLSDAAVAADLTAVMELYYDEITDSIVDSCDYDSIDLYNITQDFPLGSYAWPTLTAGSSAGSPLPEGVAAFIFARTGVSRVIAKKYFGVFAEEDVTGGIWIQVARDRLAAIGALWLDSLIEGGNGDWSNGVWSETKQAFYTFINVTVRSYPGYQRRRKPGVGI